MIGKVQSDQTSGKMLKVITLIRRKPGLSREEFRDYYENHHAPLAMRLLPMFVGYSRNYVQSEGILDAVNYTVIDHDKGWDVVSEFWFSDRAAFDECMALQNDPEIAVQLAADEGKFMDRTERRIYVVDEHVTEIGDPRF